jgi:hypothetical protein
MPAGSVEDGPDSVRRFRNVARTAVKAFVQRAFQAAFRAWCGVGRAAIVLRCCDRGTEVLFQGVVRCPALPVLLERVCLPW